MTLEDFRRKISSLNFLDCKERGQTLGLWSQWSSLQYPFSAQLNWYLEIHCWDNKPGNGHQHQLEPVLWPWRRRAPGALRSQHLVLRALERATPACRRRKAPRAFGLASGKRLESRLSRGAEATDILRRNGRRRKCKPMQTWPRQCKHSQGWSELQWNVLLFRVSSARLQDNAIAVRCCRFFSHPFVQSVKSDTTPCLGSSDLAITTNGWAHRGCIGCIIDIGAAWPPILQRVVKAPLDTRLDHC